MQGPPHLATSRFARMLIVACVILGALSGISYIAYPLFMVLLCYHPGRLAMRLLRFDDGWDALGRIVLSTSASLCITPVFLSVLFLLGVPPWLFVVVFGSIALMDSALSTNARTKPRESYYAFLRGPRWAGGLFLIVAIVVLLATIVPYWPFEFNGRVIPSAIPDFVKHHSILLAIERGGLPLVSPFFSSCEPDPAYYYDFFYLIPGAARMMISTLSIELAFGVQSALVGLSLVGLVYMIASRLFGQVSGLLAMTLVGLVGGLDVIPLAFKGLAVITIDCWAGDTLRVHSLLHQMMWTPQNVQGLMVLLLCAYMISIQDFGSRWIILAPIFACSIMKSSLWIATPGFAGAGLFLVYRIIIYYKRRSLNGSEGIVILGGLVLTVLVIVPIVYDYLEMSNRIGGGLTTHWPRHKHAILGRPVSPGLLAHMLDFPLILFLELGAAIILPLLAPRAVWRRMWGNPGGLFLVLASIASVVFAAFIRSDFTYNDLGSKGIMIAQVSGAIIGSGIVAMQINEWGVSPVRHRTRRSRIVIIVAIATIGLGLVTSLWETPMTAIRRFADPEGALGAMAPRGALLWKRESKAYRFLRYELPEDACILSYPSSDRVKLLQIANRPMAITLVERDTRVLMPSNIESCESRLYRLELLMSNGCDPQAVHDLLVEWGVSHIFVGEVERREWACVSVFEDVQLFDRVFVDENVIVVQPIPTESPP